ncbi:unnamed protein product [Tuber aestivum]|uniref:Uncharacterized protein n=1 Tax=Tuber aestivum TaxID=59557 RepID=A0A292PWK4_9PEZI|nr:unnamed protein product [Tuber aestivum]
MGQQSGGPSVILPYSSKRTGLNVLPSITGMPGLTTGVPSDPGLRNQRLECHYSTIANVHPLCCQIPNYSYWWRSRPQPRDLSHSRPCGSSTEDMVRCVG